MLDNKKFVAGYVPWEVGLDPANHSKGGVHSCQDEGQHKGQDEEPAHGGGRVHAILHLVLQQHTHIHIHVHVAILCINSAIPRFIIMFMFKNIDFFYVRT